MACHRVIGNAHPFGDEAVGLPDGGAWISIAGLMRTMLSSIAAWFRSISATGRTPMLDHIPEHGVSALMKRSISQPPLHNCAAIQCGGAR